MTKTIVIGDNEKDAPIKKPIVFTKSLSLTNSFQKATMTPSDFKFIELISKRYSGQYDIMFAYNNNSFRENGVLYLGKWNDGVVE